MTDLRVNETFYSLQGEGRRAGEPSIFIRLSGCSAVVSCRAHGVECDTNWQRGVQMSLDVLLDAVSSFSPCKWIVWTGGEPLDQLTYEVVDYFRSRGHYKQAIETSGFRPLPDGVFFEWLTISPKVDEATLVQNFERFSYSRYHMVDELKYVIKAGDPLPDPSLLARYYYLSPHCDGLYDGLHYPRFGNKGEHLTHCIKLCQENPRWSLSTQNHKIWGIR